MKELLYILTPTDGTPVTLQHAVDGWDESFVVTERSKKYHGIFRTWTTSLRFVADGATLLREEFYTYGMQATCAITVQKLNRSTLTYYNAFVGSVDFSTFKDHDTTVEVTTIDRGLAQIIKTMEGESVTFNANAFDAEFGSIDARIINRLVPPVTGSYHTAYVMPFIQVLYAVMDGITGGKITDGTYAIKSDFLEQVPIYERYYFTPMGSIKYPDSSKTRTVMQTSLADIWQTMNAIHCLGMGIEVIGGKETLVIEEREFFYNTNLIHNVGSSANLSAGYLQDFLFSKVKSGYPPVDYGESETGASSLNVSEANTETAYLINNKGYKNEYDITAKHRADSIGFEELWATETTETGDTDPVVVCLMSHTYESSPGVFVTITTNTGGALAKSYDPGVDFSTPWNMEISPVRNLLKHKRFINGCCFRMSGQQITFLNGKNEQNYNETSLTQYNNPSFRDWVKEYEGFEIDDTDTWFRPIEINIEAAYPADMVSLIAANPYGVIRFNYKGNEFEGYILKMETQLTGAGSVKYSLLSTASNDLTKLIR